MDKEIWLTATELEQLLDGDLKWSDIAHRLNQRQVWDQNEDRTRAEAVSALRTASGIRRLGQPLVPRGETYHRPGSAEPDRIGETEGSATGEEFWAQGTAGKTGLGATLEGPKVAWLLGIAATLTLSSWVYFVFLVK